MFKTFKFKQIAFISAVICLLFLLSATFNIFVPAIYTSAENGTKIPVIMYHQISENSSLFGDYVIPTKLLEEDFCYMKENGITPVSFAQVYDYAKNGGKLPKKPIIITFDDGERSFLTKVVPLLTKYGYPANINIVGALVDLYTENGDTDDRYAYLNFNDLRELSKNPLVEIGCHSYNLHSLNTRRGMGKVYGESDETYKNLVDTDIKTFNEKFSEITANSPAILAYPYGIRNDILFETAKENGFKITLTCRESVNTVTPDGDLYEMGRFNRPYGKTSEEFFGKIFDF